MKILEGNITTNSTGQIFQRKSHKFLKPPNPQFLSQAIWNFIAYLMGSKIFLFHKRLQNNINICFVQGYKYDIFVEQTMGPKCLLNVG